MKNIAWNHWIVVVQLPSHPSIHKKYKENATQMDFKDIFICYFLGPTLLSWILVFKIFAWLDVNFSSLLKALKRDKKDSVFVWMETIETC